MDKLSHYIMHGQTNGTRFFLVFSLVLSVLLGGVFGLALYQLPQQPEIQHMLDDFPEVIIENGTITSPIDTVWQSPSIPSEMMITIDTRETPQTESPKMEGIYLLKNSVLVNAKGQTHTSPWPLEKNILTKETILETFQHNIPKVAFLLTVFFFAILWLGLILTVLLTRFIIWLIRRTQPRARITRAAVVGWSTIILLDVILLTFHYGFSLLMALVLGTCISVIGLFYGYSND